MARMLKALLAGCVATFILLSPCTAKSLELNPQELAWQAAHKQIRVGIPVAQPPYAFRDARGRLQGIAIDYLQALNEGLGIDFRIVPLDSADDGPRAMAAGRVDMLVVNEKGIPHTNTLQTQAYYKSSEVIVTRKDAGNIHHRRDLEGKRLALPKDAPTSKRILQAYEDIGLVMVESQAAALEALLADKADAYVGDLGQLEAILRGGHFDRLKIAALYSVESNKHLFAVRSDWSELVGLLNKGMIAIPASMKRKIKDRWIEAQFATVSVRPAILEFLLTQEESRWLDEHPVIRLGADPQWAPVEYFDQDGRYQGMVSEYLQRLESLLGVTFKVVQSDNWQQALELARNGQVDGMTALMPTPIRSEFLQFSHPYIDLRVATFARPEMPHILDLSELAGRRVAVVQGYAFQEKLSKDYPELQLVAGASVSEALDMLASGKVDAYVGTIATTGHYLREANYSQIKIIGDTPSYQLHLAMGMRKDIPHLSSIIDKAISVIPEQERAQIYSEWMAIRFEHGFDYTLLWQVLAVVLVAFLAFSYWTYRLRREVHLRQQAEEELRGANSKLQELDRMKSMFIASMSHELRTPLNSIIGFSSLIEGEAFGELHEKYKDYVMRINRAGNHLLSLITDIIDISKVEAGHTELELETFPLDSVVIDSVETLQKQISDKGLELNLNVEPGIEMCSDRRRVYQCMLNLLSNAMKYTEAGSIDVDARQENNKVIFSVRDTGIGIRQDEIPRLFEPFERLESHMRVKSGGTGLGLYLTRKITEQLLGGEILVESAPAVGSTFTLILPMVAEEAQVTAAMEER